MPQIRRATVADADTICHDRLRMFVDSGLGDESAMPPIIAHFAKWLKPRLADSTYLGWIAEEAGASVGGIGIWLMD